jgi:hypothetical protein
MNLDLLCLSNEHCDGGTYSNEVISTTKAVQHKRDDKLICLLLISDDAV